MKYYQDNTFFEIINTEHKAYWLGFLYADGCISDNRNKKYVHIMLHKQDAYILEQFVKDLRSNRLVKETAKGYVRLDIFCGEMGEDLIKLGCVPRKSNILKFPTKEIVDNKFLPHFLRGFLDGDGCISVYYKKKGRAVLLVCEIKFIGTFSMLDGIKNFFESDKKVLQNKHSPTSYQISFTGRKYRKYVDLIYKDSTIHLTRKKEKWDNFIKEVEDKEKRKKQKVITNKIVGKVVKTTFEIVNPKQVQVKENLKVEPKEYKKLKEKYHKEYLEYRQDKKNKKSWRDDRVEQYNLNGELLKIWDSYNEAASFYNINQRSIRRCCNGEIKTYFKFKWRYCTKRYGSSSKVIYQYDLDKNLIKKWGSLKEAALFYNLTPQSIERCANREVKKTSNYIWSYELLFENT